MKFDNLEHPTSGLKINVKHVGFSNQMSEMNQKKIFNPKIIFDLKKFIRNRIIFGQKDYSGDHLFDPKKIFRQARSHYCGDIKIKRRNAS